VSGRFDQPGDAPRGSRSRWSWRRTHGVRPRPLAARDVRAGVPGV